MVIGIVSFVLLLVAAFASGMFVECRIDAWALIIGPFCMGIEDAFAGLYVAIIHPKESPKKAPPAPPAK